MPDLTPTPWLAEDLAALTKLRSDPHKDVSFEDVTAGYPDLNDHDSVFRIVGAPFVVKVKQVEFAQPFGGHFTLRITGAICDPQTDNARAARYGANPLILVGFEIGVNHDGPAEIEVLIQEGLQTIMDRAARAWAHHNIRRSFKRVQLTEHRQAAGTKIAAIGHATGPRSQQP